MIAVRLEDGSTVYGFGANSVTAKNSAGTPDPYWQRAAEASVEERADVYDGLMALPGATLIHAGAVRPAPLERPPTLPEAERRRRNKGR